ncbi:MAG: DUF2207 domain-containing protein [Coriobacteriia bacterium]|nr:DUF2207 domain-containing protein [Coriobacteriia bacterium]
MATSAPRYLREPPDLHPAVVGCLARRGRIGAREILASVLLLVADGALVARSSTRRVTTIASAHDIGVLELRPVPERWEGLDPLDQGLIALLFGAPGGPGALSLPDLQAAIRKRPRWFRAGVADWQRAVGSRAETLGLMRDGALTPAGATARREHAAFQRFLKDFGTLDDEPTLAIELWGPYLAYAVLFGLGDRVARELAVDSPSAARDPNLAVWRAWFGLD